MRKTLVYTFVACLLIAAMPYSVSADATEDIPTNAAATGVHDALVQALVHADLVTTLEGDGPFTVFAPTDQAFTDAGISLSDYDTPEENMTLTNILLYHVYSGNVASADVTDGLTVEMVNGEEATFTVSSDTVMIQDATVTTPDVAASNGVIHVIDQVLIPPSLSDNDDDDDDLITPEEILAAADTDDSGTMTLDEFNAAFGGEEIDVNDPKISEIFDDNDADASGDLDATEIEGFIAEIDAYLEGGHDDHDGDHDHDHDHDGDHDHDEDDVPTPQELLDATDSDGSGGMSFDEFNAFMNDDEEGAFPQSVLDDFAEIFASNDADDSGELDLSELEQFIPEIDAYMIALEEGGFYDIPTIASQTGIHESLVAALIVADLVSTLQGEGPFTVFAPTDEAFAAAGIDLDDTTLSTETLKDILLYHVVAGTTMSTDLAEGANVVTTANGDELTITVSDAGVAVGADGASVTIADVEASNGVIHVIDKVLTPPADDPFQGIDCAKTIGLTTDGYGFTPSVVNIEPGQTVCWSWTDAAMEHNVKQVDGFQSSTYVAGGVTSGDPATTVAFHHTFTENQTFYYACEPHVSMKMHGEIVVGDGGVDSTSDKKETEDAPGFVASTMILAMLGAVLFVGRRRSL